MLRIEAMTNDIVKEFRNTSTIQLRRTLVSANEVTANKYLKKTKSEDISQAKKKFGVSFVKSTEDGAVKTWTCRPQLPSNASSDHQKYYNLLKNVIGYLIENKDGSANYANSTTKTIQQHREGQFLEQVIENTYTCFYNGQVLVSAKGSNQKKARAEGVQKLYQLLKNYCPFLIRKVQCCAEDNKVVDKDGKAKPVPGTNGAIDVDTFQSNKLGSDNIGYKMLKALGWKEGDSAKNSIIDPIGLSVKIGRGGLGSDADKVGKHLNVKYFREMMRTYGQSNTEFDLVFSKEFTKEERAELHKIAQKLGLKSKSAGKEGERFLVVSKKVALTPMEIVQKIEENDSFYNAIWTLNPPDLKEFSELNL